jgi:hypothetical protein
VISFTNPEAITLVLAAALAGTLVAQGGISLLNRWGRHPRLDEAINLALKGMDDRFALFHYGLAAPHIVTGPPGTFALLPQNDDGDFSIEEGRWWRDQAKRGILKRGGRRELNGLTREAQRQADNAQKSLAKHLAEGESIDIRPLIVFTNDQARVHIEPEVEGVVVLHRAKLKDWLRRGNRGSRLTEGRARALAESLGLVAS